MPATTDAPPTIPLGTELSAVLEPDEAEGAPAQPRWLAVMAGTGRFLFSAGVVLALFAGYQLWGTGVQEARAQSGLRSEFLDLLVEDPVIGRVQDVGDAAGEETTEEAPGDEALDPDSTTQPIDAATLAALTPDEGEPVARLEIPAIGVDKITIEGVQVADLRNGPGHYPATARPGTGGNAAIAGHRTTYGQPFNRIDELLPGDELTITTLEGRFTYRVLAPADAFEGRDDDMIETGAGHAIVSPSATWVLDDFGDSRLTLTACHPKMSARQRIIVVAELVSPESPFEPVLVAEPAETPTDPADDSGGVESVSTRPRAADLDEGLDGDRDAIAPAIMWLVVAASMWIVPARVARRRGVDTGVMLAVRVVSLAPVMAALWWCFEATDRALPAY